MNRRPHVLATFLAAAALVFAQFAVAAHLCEVRSPAEPAEVIVHQECCPDGDRDAGANSNVCQLHCLYGDVSFDNAQPAAAAVDAAGPVLRVQSAAMAASIDARPAWRRVPSAAPRPPAILFGVLRI